MTVLILAHERDPTADRVAAELTGRGVPVARVDPANFPTKTYLAAEISSNKQWVGSIRGAEGNTVELANVVSVYYRHPSQLQLPEGMSGPEKVFAYGEGRRGFGGVLQGLKDCLWVNDPVCAARCEYKPVQLAAAASVGLAIPDTIITNDPQQAHAWVRSLGRPVVYKTMAGIWHADEDQLRVIYTSPITSPDDLLDPSLALTAHMFQAQIDKTREARALVVGDRVYTVAIDVHSDQGRIDWRSDYNHTYEIIDLPDEVSGKLVELHRRLGLVFGAVDLIHDTSGEWVFLETNQGGEWGWLAEQGVPVAEALADILEKGTRWSR